MSTIEELPGDPVELAAVRAEQAVNSDGIEATEFDRMLLAELDYSAEQLGFINRRYFVQCARSLIVPTSFEAGRPLSLVDIFDLTFEGYFATYSKVHVGRIIGAGAIRAVCLTFTNATLLPYFDRVSEDQMMLVPVLAVDSIDATD